MASSLLSFSVTLSELMGICKTDDGRYMTNLSCKAITLIIFQYSRNQLIERKEGRWKGKKEGSWKKGGKQKEERKLAGWLMRLPCGEDQATTWEGFQVSKEAQ